MSSLTEAERADLHPCGPGACDYCDDELPEVVERIIADRLRQLLASCPQCRGTGEVVAFATGAMVECRSCRWVRAALAHPSTDPDG